GEPGQAAEQILGSLAYRLGNEPTALPTPLVPPLLPPPPPPAAHTAPPRHRREPAGRDHQRHHPRRHGLPAPHQIRRARHRRPGTGHQPAASLHDLAGSPAPVPAPLAIALNAP